MDANRAAISKMAAEKMWFSVFQPDLGSSRVGNMLFCVECSIFLQDQFERGPNYRFNLTISLCFPRMLLVFTQKTIYWHGNSTVPFLKSV